MLSLRGRLVTRCIAFLKRRIKAGRKSSYYSGTNTEADKSKDTRVFK